MGFKKTRVLFSGTLSHTLDLADFSALSSRYVDSRRSAVNLVRPSRIYRVWARTFVYNTFHVSRSVARFPCGGRDSCWGRFFIASDRSDWSSPVCLSFFYSSERFVSRFLMTDWSRRSTRIFVGVLCWTTKTSATPICLFFCAPTERWINLTKTMYLRCILLC